jgi:DNA-directed RNA polymerase specialized sigma24 family protein
MEFVTGPALDGRKQRTACSEKEQFFSSIYKEYWYKVDHYSYLYTGIRSEAEDMAKEVFLKLWEQLDRLNGVLKSVEGDLFLMVRNSCPNHYKKELRKKPLYKNYCRSWKLVITMRWW